MSTEDKSSVTTMEVDESSSSSGSSSKKRDENVTPSASGENTSKYPSMSLAQSIHKLTMMSGTATSKIQLDEKDAGIDIPSLVEKVRKEVGDVNENASLLEHLQSTLRWTDNKCLDDDTLTKMKSKHAETMESLEKKVEEAKENAGDMEVLDARFEIARFAAQSLSKEETLKAYEKVLALPKLSSGKQMDALMESARVASFYGDLKKSLDFIAQVTHYLTFKLAFIYLFIYLSKRFSTILFPPYIIIIIIIIIIIRIF